MIDPHKLVVAAQTAPLPWTQRLGYLLEQIDATETAALKDHVSEHATKPTLLLTKAPRRGASLDVGWKLYVNADVEPEL